jgi:hypothetical protein
MAQKKQTEEKKATAYTFEDAMKIADDIFALQKENEYNPGAFVHGLIVALEATQQSYDIPPKKIAEVKRGVRKYIQQVSAISQQKQ